MEGAGDINSEASMRSQLSNLCNYFAFVSQVELKPNNEAILISIGF